MLGDFAMIQNYDCSVGSCGGRIGDNMDLHIGKIHFRDTEMKYEFGIWITSLSDRGALSLSPRIPSPVVVPTFWCTTCQMSLRSHDEQLGHKKYFPSHLVKTVGRLVCPNCGNVVPLENGYFPEHWMGSSGSPRRCNGSRRKV